MSTYETAWVMRQEHLTDAQFRVLFWLAECSAGQEVHRDVARVARLTGKSEIELIKVLGELFDLKLVDGLVADKVIAIKLKVAL